MKKLSLVSFAVTAALAISPALLLGQSENFTISIDNNGVVFTGSGTISTATTYSAVAGGGTATDGYLITSFTGNLSFISPPAPANPPYTGPVTLVPSTNPGGNFVVSDIMADNLLFIGNDVRGAGTGYFDNSGLIVAGGAYYMNIMTGQSIYPGSAGLPYWVFYNDNGTYQWQTDATTPAVITVPEFDSLSMLILCILALAGAFCFKATQSGLFLNS